MRQRTSYRSSGYYIQTSSNKHVPFNTYAYKSFKCKLIIVYGLSEINWHRAFGLTCVCVCVSAGVCECVFVWKCCCVSHPVLCQSQWGLWSHHLQPTAQTCTVSFPAASAQTHTPVILLKRSAWKKITRIRPETHTDDSKSLILLLVSLKSLIQKPRCHKMRMMDTCDCNHILIFTLNSQIWFTCFSPAWGDVRVSSPGVFLLTGV